MVTKSRPPASARLALRAGDYARSLSLTGEEKPATLSSDMLAMRVEALIKGGNFRSAEKMLAVLGERPEAGPSLSRLHALLAIQQRDYVRAISIHMAALAERPGDEWHRIRLARAHGRRGAIPLARELLAQGLAVQPHAFALLIEDAAILRRAGMISAAAERLAQAQAIQPENASLYRHQGELATLMGDHRGASVLHGKALERDSHNPGHRVRLARSLERAGEPDEALRLIEAGLAIYPQSAPLLVEIVRMAIRRNELAEAADRLDRLASHYPDNVRVRELRAELAEAAGDHADATRHRKKQMGRFPNDSGSAILLADGLRRQGDRAAALVILRAISAPTPRSQMLASRLLIELGRYDECREILAAWDQADTAMIEKWRIEMRLASAEYRFAESGAAARALLKQLPEDLEAGKAEALAATLTFDTDAAWTALKRVQIVPLGEGPKRRGGRRLRSLFGHIANEFRLRDGQTRSLARTSARGDVALKRAAAAILRDDPASLPATFAMLMALARTGKLHAEPQAGEARIPRLLHQYWDRQIPEDVAALTQDTRRANPDLAHRIWGDKSARAFLREFDDPIYMHAYKRARHVAVKSDLLRLALLWRLGGYYMDADDLAVAPVSALAATGSRLVLYQERMASIGNNFMAAAPGHPLIKLMLDQAAHEIGSGGGDSPWLATGPGLVSRVIAGALAQDTRTLRRHAVQIIPLHCFRATVEAGRKVDYKAGTRHWKRAS